MNSSIIDTVAADECYKLFKFNGFGLPSASQTAQVQPGLISFHTEVSMRQLNIFRGNIWMILN
jgi:hypothetical protein